MSWFTRFINLNVNEWWKAPKKDEVVCEVDGEDVDCLTFKLIDKGFHFNVEKDWYERTWVVATKDGAETSKEVYQKKGDHWKVIMFGDQGDVFFEKTIP
tara:strand:- start:434 stop:730 length:297 start_codon:yes stop_codon:yes gene_type:complete